MIYFEVQEKQAHWYQATPPLSLQIEKWHHNTYSRGNLYLTQQIMGLRYSSRANGS